MRLVLWVLWVLGAVVLFALGRVLVETLGGLRDAWREDDERWTVQNGTVIVIRRGSKPRQR